MGKRVVRLKYAIFMAPFFFTALFIFHYYRNLVMPPPPDYTPNCSLDVETMGIIVSTVIAAVGLIFIKVRR